MPIAARLAANQFSDNRGGLNGRRNRFAIAAVLSLPMPGQAYPK